MTDDRQPRVRAIANMSCRLSTHRLGKHPASAGKFRRLLILVDQHLWPLALGLSRRPCSGAYALGPSVFTIREKTMRTVRASVSQAVASRGAPPLPAMSLETCRCWCLGREDLLPSPVPASHHPLATVRIPVDRKRLRIANFEFRISVNSQLSTLNTQLCS
jgi:hypothetical protein